MPLGRARRRLWSVAAASVVLGSYPALSMDPVANEFWWPLCAVAVAALISVPFIGIAAIRNHGRVRGGWFLLTASVCLVVLLQLLYAFPATRHGVAPPILNGMAVLLAASAAIAMPGASRSPRGWLLLVLDGWLIGGALFTAFWVLTGMSASASLLQSESTANGLWLMVDLVLTCVVFGLTRQVPRDRRTSALALSLATAALAVSDLDRSFLSEQAGRGGSVYVLAGFALCGFVAVAPWLGAGDPYAGSPTDAIARAGQRAVRLPYVVAFIAIAVGVVQLNRNQSFQGLLLANVLLMLAAVMISEVLLATENSRLFKHVSAMAEEYRERASRDSLTGLPNRTIFNSLVQSALEGPARGRTAVLFIDLDGFKDVNDSLGHVVGDQLLVECAKRLQLVMRNRDVVARFGGDEFVALLSDCGEEQAIAIAERVRESLAHPYLVGSREVVVSASIGLATPSRGDEATDALRNADLALYSAKRNGRDRVALYQPEMHVSALRRLDGAARLRLALADGQLTLAYQPQVSIQTGAIYGFEALLRFDVIDLPGWTVSEAIAVAEETGLVVAVGRWVIDAAMRTAGAWAAQGRRVTMAVNISPRQLEEGSLYEVVSTALTTYQVPAELVVLEITEHQLVSDLDSSTRELDRLRSLGVGVALDDFGTGYSSLSYLPRLPLTALKIDRALVQRVGQARDTIPAVLLLGRDLGLTVVAEGVETHEQFRRLRDMGCELSQGFLTGVPVDEAAATAMLTTGRVAVEYLAGEALVGSAPDFPSPRPAAVRPHVETWGGGA